MKAARASKTKLDRMCGFLTKHRIAALATVLCVTIVFLYGAFHIRSETVLFEQFPYNHPYLKLMGQFQEIFGGGGSGVSIVIQAKHGDIFNRKTLTKIRAMTTEVELWDEVYRLLTVSMASNSTKVVRTKARGEIAVETLLGNHIPETPEEMNLLKRNIFSDPGKRGILVSEDGSAAFLRTVFKEDVSYRECYRLLQGLRKAYTDNDTSVHIVGFPMLMGYIYSLRTQTFAVFAISILAIIVVLFLIFRNFQGMFSPVANAGILTIWGLGFVGLTGINFSPMLYVLAFLVGARMIGNSHQIAYRYFEELDSSGGDREKACFETMRTMWVPNFAAVGADVAGFAVLFLARIVLMQHLAVIMTFWMATILMTGFLVPVLCSVFPFRVKTGEWKKETCQMDWKAALIMKISRFSIAPRTRCITGAIIILVAAGCFYEMTKLKVGDPTPGTNIFYANHPYNKDTALINSRFRNSSDMLSLYWNGGPGSVYNPAVLETFEGFDRHIADQLPDIYKSSASIIDAGKMFNLTYHDGDQVWSMLPRDPAQSTALLGLLRQSIGTANLRLFVDGDVSKAQILVFFADHSSDNLLRIRDAAYGFFKNHAMNIEGQGAFELAGGSIGMELALNEEMRRSHLLIDLAVYAAIFLLCALCYKSIVAGLMLTVPLVFANAMCGAYMALRGIGLSINTLPIAAIGAGLGVDFAIYLYSRAIEEFPLQNGDWTETVMQCVCTCGKAVIYTGITVILPILTWYFFSDMRFQADVGFFLSLVMAVNVILCMTLHPLLLSVIKPKFVSRAKGSFAGEKRPAVVGTLPIG